MKGSVAFLVVLMLGLTAYNWWQVRELRDEVARLKVQVAEQQNQGSVSDQMVARAVSAIAQARESIGGMNTDSARSALNKAGDYLAQAGRTVGSKAAPTVDWLKDQASSLGRQMQDKINRR